MKIEYEEIIDFLLSDEYLGDSMQLDLQNLSILTDLINQGPI